MPTAASTGGFYTRKPNPYLSMAGAMPGNMPGMAQPYGAMMQPYTGMMPSAMPGAMPTMYPTSMMGMGMQEQLPSAHPTPMMAGPGGMHMIPGMPGSTVERSA